MRFTVDIRTRPIRTAIVIPPNDANSLLRAISINSFLWGGYLNPIIPLFKRVPKSWQNNKQNDFSCLDIQKGYLDAFDPDFITFLDCDETKKLASSSRKTIDINSLIKNVEKSGDSPYGVGYFELARFFGYEELRFVRNKPANLVLPKLGEHCKPFLASVVGTLPKEVEDLTQKNLREAYSSPDFTVSLDSFSECLDHKYVTPLRLGRYKLEADPYERSWDRDLLFYFDANCLNDVIDFWNLRALGFKVFPIPKQVILQPGVMNAARQFALDNYVVSQHNLESVWRVTLLKGRSISPAAFDAFVNTCDFLKDLLDHPPRLQIRNSFPEFWNSQQRDLDNCGCIRFFSDQTVTEVIAEDNWIRFNSPIPKFVDSSSSGFCVANEVAFRSYCGNEMIAQIFPQAEERLGAAFGTHPFYDDWRFSVSGAVHFPKAYRQSATFGIPKSQTVVEKWFSCGGWKVTTSSAGLATNELFKHLGGTYQLPFVLNDEKLIRILNELGSGQTFSHHELKMKLWPIASRRGLESAGDIIAALMSSKLIALGICVRCPTCGRHPWFELSNIKSIVECTECLRTIDLPTHLPDLLQWSYKGIGPLISLSTSSGAIPVLLVYRFFSTILHMRMTTAFGIELSRDNMKHEIDLFSFVQESEFRHPRKRMMFAECKSHNSFSVTDISRLKKLGAQYPNSILVFATLRKRLSNAEIRWLLPLAKRGWRTSETGAPLNPVMLLTGNELFSEFPLSTYRDGVLEKNNSSHLLRYDEDLLGWCNATQHLYLKTKPVQLPMI
ncbi:MAG: hypothetical protein U0894_04195 [Pirellulales bacterium]